MNKSLLQVYASVRFNCHRRGCFYWHRDDRRKNVSSSVIAVSSFYTNLPHCFEFIRDILWSAADLKAATPSICSQIERLLSIRLNFRWINSNGYESESRGAHTMLVFKFPATRSRGKLSRRPVTEGICSKILNYTVQPAIQRDFLRQWPLFRTRLGYRKMFSWSVCSSSRTSSRACPFLARMFLRESFRLKVQRDTNMNTCWQWLLEL